MWYGWIPVLNNDKPSIIRGRHPVSTNRFIIHECREEEGFLRVSYRARNMPEEDITVTIVDGFFQMDGLDRLEHMHASLVMNSLYTLLKESHHMDITHSYGDGLMTVEADTVDEACVLIADMIAESCEEFLLRAEGCWT